MKNIRKVFAWLLSIGLAAVMAFSISVPAVAAEGGAGTPKGYTYYVMMKLDPAAEYYVEEEGLAAALAGLTIRDIPIFTVEETQTGQRWAVSANDEADCTQEEVADALASIKALAIESGSLTGNSLDLGYAAFVLIQTRAGIYCFSEIENASQSIFARPMTVDKNVGIPVVEGMSAANGKISAGIGEKVTYTIQVKKENPAEVVLNQSLSNGMTLDAVPVVRVDGGEEISEVWITWTEGTATETGTRCYTMTLPQELNGKYEITCSATINENARVSEAETVQAWLAYEGQLGEATKQRCNFYTFGFDLVEVNGGGEALQGSSFTLKNSTTGKYYKLPTDAANDCEARFQSDASEVKTDASGKISFTGLEPGTYILKETAAVEGYSKLPGEITIEIHHDGTLTVSDASAGSVTNATRQHENTSESKRQSYYGTLNVVNHTNMPSTGGSGTVIFYAVGGTLMFGAAALLACRRKYRRQEQS